MKYAIFLGRRGRASRSGPALGRVLRRTLRRAAPVSARPPAHRTETDFPAPAPRETLALVRGYARLPPTLRRQVLALIRALGPREESGA
jgi:hypothetical protein